MVTNTGSVNLVKVTIEDSKFDLSQMVPVESMTEDGILEVGETWTYSYTYVVTEADVTQNNILNKASVTVTPEDPENPGEPDTDTPPIEEEDEEETPVAKFDLDKSVAQKAFGKVGDVLDYTIVLTNTGNVNLVSVLITDTKYDLSGIEPIESMTKDGILEVGETWTYTYEYVVTAEDVRVGSVMNSAYVESTPEDPEKPGEPDKETPPIKDEDEKETPKASFVLEKFVEQTSYSKVGDTLEYTVVLRNIGNVNLVSVKVSDSKVDLSKATLVESITTDGILEIGETWTYTYKYVVTEADVDAKSVINTAKAEVVPEDPENPGKPDPEIPPIKDEDTQETPKAAFKLDKYVKQDFFAKVGDKLDYTIVLTNTGNVNLVNIEITDTKFDLRNVVPVESMTQDGILEIGETWTYKYQYVVTQVDVNAKAVVNTALAKATPEDPNNPGQPEQNTPPLIDDGEQETPHQPTPEKPELPKTGSATNYFNLFGSLMLVGGILILKKKREDQ